MYCITFHARRLVLFSHAYSEVNPPSEDGERGRVFEIFWLNVTYINFIYSEKATKFCEIFTLLLSVCIVDKSKVKICGLLRMY